MHPPLEGVEKPSGAYAEWFRQRTVPIGRQRVTYQISVKLLRVADLRPGGWANGPFAWNHQVPLPSLPADGVSRAAGGTEDRPVAHSVESTADVARSS